MPTPASIRDRLIAQALSLGFSAAGISGTALPEDERHFERWLASGRHGEMGFMARHGRRRTRPSLLRPGTMSVLSVACDYWPPDARPAEDVLADPALGYVARYALGRDYHKLMRNRLQRLADHMVELVGPLGYRVYVDSGPVLERALARNAGIGWIGKHTNLISRERGSWFFLGELYTDLELPVDTPAAAHCGTCTACIPACPTGAIVAPYELDARRCISYLTIELQGAIPPELRPAIGNRIYGCDDCQLVCPWNRHARAAAHADFRVRQGLDGPRLSDLLGWTRAQFDAAMRGSAIYRLGYERWLRNIAVALGNAPPSEAARAALRRRQRDPSALVREHVAWALARQAGNAG